MEQLMPGLVCKEHNTTPNRKVISAKSMDDICCKLLGQNMEEYKDLLIKAATIGETLKVRGFIPPSITIPCKEGGSRKLSLSVV